MTPFWLAGAALALVVLAVVLRPLVFRRPGAAVSRTDANVSIYRDQLRELDADLAAGTLAQADYERARREIEARVLEDVAPAAAPAPARRGRLLPAALALGVPLVALGVYLAVGSPAALQLEMEREANARQIEAMVERLAQRLRERPDEVEGWKLLGRSLSTMGRFEEALQAYGRAAALAPRDASLLADYADALAMSQGQRLAGEPEKLALRALEADPKHLKALALAGTAAFERKDFAAAVRYWERMLPQVAAGSEDARTIQASIDEAKSFLSARPLRGRVSLGAKVKDKAAPDDTVFVFARAAEGPPAPLAVLRKQVRDLPLEFSLDDTMAMAPGLRLSGFPRVVVSARVSKSGNAAAQPGDLQGASAPVANDARGVNVVIDSIIR